MTPLNFLNLLWQLKPEEMYVLIWTLHDKSSHWYCDVAAAAEFVVNARGLDVYVGVGLSRADRGPTHRCVSDDVAGISGFWADLDLKSEAHSKALPATIADAISIIPECMPPTVVIATGNGAHAWWLFKEPYVFDDAEDRKDTAMLVSRWQTLLRLRASQHGWAFDRLSDLARVLRIPGTVNLKDPSNPKPVTLHSATDRRYNLSDFEDYLDDAAVPDPEAEEKATREWAERFADKALVIDINARIPQEMLDGWMVRDLRFKNTWLRQRHDLKDQSQSGYDMALAAFGAQAGLTEQQIVDLTRRAEEQARRAATGGVAAALPTTLAMLLAEFMKQYAEDNLAPKTIERYEEMAEYLSPELLGMTIGEITPLDLSREWARLLKSGGHTRRTKEARPMKPKTVRNIAGLVSSAYLRAIKWGLATVNPVTHSELPRLKKRAGLALLPAEQDLLTACSLGPWCLQTFLEMCVATGCRRGDVLALRWSDIRNNKVFVDRSLCQTRDGLVYKTTKTEEPRDIALPPGMAAVLEAHRLRQDKFRRQFGPDYRADLDLIFANPDGTELKPDSISATVSRICRRLGLPKGSSLHTVRHSHASILLEKGVAITTVSERMGHSSVRTTADIYSHALRGKDEEAAEIFGKVMQSAREAVKATKVN